MNITDSIAKWFDKDGDVSYDRRLEAVKELGQLFPGWIMPIGHAYKSLGFFAGIYLQTQWQRNSKRDHLPIWFFINQSLTLAPFAYAQEFIAFPDEPYKKSQYIKEHPTRNFTIAPITQVDTCKAWKTYFHAASSGTKFRCLPLLWRAHTTAIRHALWQYQEEFETSLIPSEEISFWQGWIWLVLSLEKVSPPTNDFFLQPLLAITMPQYLLGEKQNTTDQQNIVQSTFLKWITRSPMSQQQFIKKYGRLPESAIW